MEQCSARNRKGEQCKRPVTSGRTVCYLHGGASLAGLASRTWKHGRYSKYLPGGILAGYKRALKDPELLALREDIALWEGRLLDVLKRVTGGESGRLWKMLQLCYSDMLEARDKGDGVEVAARLNELGDLIQRGIADYAAWAEVRDIIEHRRRLIETEFKRLVALQQIITQEQAMMLVAALVDTVRRNVSDPAILAAISADITRLITREPGPAIISEQED